MTELERRIDVVLDKHLGVYHTEAMVDFVKLFTDTMNEVVPEYNSDIVSKPYDVGYAKGRDESIDETHINIQKLTKESGSV